MARLLLSLTLLFLTSCTTYMVRNQCERTDWYGYGRSVAMKGKRLSGDAFIRKCEDVEAVVDDIAVDHGFKEGMENYCQPDVVFQTGKQGEFFTGDMCEQARSLSARHAAGVRIFCQKPNGFAVGATGRDYNGICPADLEAAFKQEFNRGRNSFLSATLATNDGEIAQIEMRISQIESQRMMTNGQIMQLGDVYSPKTGFVVNPVTGIQEFQTIPADPMLMNQRATLESQISVYDSEIGSERNRQRELRETNRKLQMDMLSL